MLKRLGEFAQFRHAQKPSTFHCCLFSSQYSRERATGKCVEIAAHFWIGSGFRRHAATMRLAHERRRSIQHDRAADGRRGDRRGRPRRTRRQSADGPKQYRSIGGKAVIARTLEAFLAHPRIGPIVVVIHPDDGELFARRGRRAAERGRLSCMAARRGRNRCGLASRRCATQAPDVGADPRRRAAVRRRGADRPDDRRDRRAPGGPAGAAGRRHAEARGGDGIVVRDRAARRPAIAAQTPQGFPFWPILAAHEKAVAAGQGGFHRRRGDRRMGRNAGEASSRAHRTMSSSPGQGISRWPISGFPASAFPDVRTGNGYDVHAFEPGDHVTLCGVAIPHDKKLSGHSDADVGAACADRRAARHLRRRRYRHAFPAIGSAMEGRGSRIFVEHAARLVRDARRAHRQCRHHADLRGAAHRAASRGDGRGADRNARRSRPTASRSRRRPTRSSASSAARKASRRSPRQASSIPGDVPE